MQTSSEPRDLRLTAAAFPGAGQAGTFADFKRRSVFVVLVTLGGVSALAAMWQARVILLVLFAGCLAALVLATLTSLVQRWLRVPRTLAFAILLTALILAIALGVWLRGPALAEQFGKLQTDLPEAARRLYSSLGESSWGKWIRANGPGDLPWSSWLSYAASGIRGAVSIVVSTVVCLLLVAMTAIYLGAEPQFYLRGLRRILPSSTSTTVEACLDGAVRTLRYWLLSRAVSMVAIGIIVTAGLWLLSVPLAGTLGIVAAFLTFIPNLGPVLSAMPAALLAFAISPTKGFLTIGVFCLAHFLEGNLITPIVDRRVVKLPPFLTLLLQLILAPVTGALGVAMAAPLLAATMGVVRVLRPSPSELHPRIETSQRL